MAAITLSNRPSKKQRSSPATSFIASPQAVQKSEALKWKHTEPDHFQLRYISSREISLETAAQDSPQGFDICVSPQSGSGTNEFFKDLASQQQKFQDLEQRISTVELYMNALYTSVEMCAADLPMFSLYILDYHLRRIFKDQKCNHANPKEFQSLFVGLGKGKPFKGIAGDQIRYSFLLSCMHRLSENMQSQEGKDGDLDGDEDLTEKLSAFHGLLLGAEECLIATITYCGIEPPTTAQIREDCLNFLQGTEKKARDSATHLVCDMFFQQRQTPFEKLWLRDTIFPPENYSLFPKDNSALSAESLMRLGLKVIALIDIEKRMKAPSSTSYALHTAAPLMTDVGLQLAKYFIKTKGKFMCSMVFKYGALTATLEIDPTKPPKVVDLGSMKGLAISA